MNLALTIKDENKIKEFKNGDKIDIVNMSLFYLVACTNIDDVDSITLHINQMCPSGTSSGWKINEDETCEYKDEYPCKCTKNEGFKHYLFAASCKW